MAKTPRPQLDQLADAVLFELYDAAGESPSIHLSLDDLHAERFSSRIGKKLIQLALQHVINRELASENREVFPYAYEITFDGYTYVESQLELPEMLVTRYANSGVEVLLAASGADVPASDRIVRIDHNLPAFGEVEVAIKTALEEVRKSNDLSEEDQGYSAQLRASLELIQAPLVSAELLERVLVGSLRYFATKFADHAMGIAAAAALTLALQFFGLG